MNSYAPHDTLPWYKQFWPWFLIFLPGSVVVAGFITLYIANEHADDLVADDYYKDGLAINQQLAHKKRAGELGISAVLEFSKHSVSAILRGPVASSELQLTLSHPLEADRDITMNLVRVQPGVYAAMPEQTLNGRWHWTLINSEEQPWRLDGSATVVPVDDAPR
jgi:uncharacterized protein